MASPLPDDHYPRMMREFAWQVPRRFNMAQVCAARWAARADAGHRVAIIEHAVQGPARRFSYAQLQQTADRLSHQLRRHGVRAGDRVALVLPQRFETAAAYIAILQMGAVAVPLSLLFGPDALSYRLADSGAVAAVVDEQSVAQLQGVRALCPGLRTLVGVGGAAAQCELPWPSSGRARRWPLSRTGADDPAVLIYTSGTTGPPKGALIPHRALIGNLTGFVCSQNWFGFDPKRQRRHESDAVFWSPADWAWTGGLMDALLPTLYFGRPIVAWAGRFNPELAFGLMQEHRVSHTFLFPTALKAMMKAYPEPAKEFQLQLRAIMSAGEAVGDAVFAFCREQLGVVVNEMFGQTEINYIVGNCAMNDQRDQGVGWPAKPGSMGKGYPGHWVDVIDEEGRPVADGVPGDVAVHRTNQLGQPDPIFFLGYWNNPEATAGKYSGDWCRTGDLALRDADGYLWYQGRSDDVFKSAGYRIGPSEIENCLVKHPAVANAAVVPKPDPQRGALVKAYVVLAPGHAGDAALVQALKDHVRGLLAPYEYPKEIEFIEALPMTTTGKVQRRVLRLQEEERARQRP
ncbi:MAG: AMP-binding protein [Alphaproteobacteria bacterium]|nr:AMP-binding protein [Alphaproteobacteria bacterium]